MKSGKEIKDVIWLMGLQGLNYLAPLIVMPYLMIVLGAEKFGYIGFSFSVVQYLMLLVDFGFNFSTTKRIAQLQGNKEKINEVFWATIAAKLILLVVSFILVFIIAFAIPEFRIYSRTILIMSLMVIGQTFTFIWLFQGVGKIRIVAIINSVSKLLILPLTFIFVKEPEDYNIAALIQSLVYVFSSLLAIGVLLKNKYVYMSFKTTKNKIINELKLSYPIFISTAASSVYTALFAIVLGYFTNPTEVGKYTAAEKIMRALCMFIYLPVTQAFYPKISALTLKSKTESWRLIRRILLFIVGSMAILFIALFFFSDLLISFLGDGYAGTEKIFRIMAYAPLLIASGGILGQLGLLAAGDERDKKYFQNVYFIAAGVAIILVFVMAPRYASIGTAFTLVFVEFIVFIGMFWFTRKQLFSKNHFSS